MASEILKDVPPEHWPMSPEFVRCDEQSADRFDPADKIVIRNIAWNEIRRKSSKDMVREVVREEMLKVVETARMANARKCGEHLRSAYRTRGSITVPQQNYVTDIAETYGIHSCSNFADFMLMALGDPRYPDDHVLREYMENGKC